MARPHPALIDVAAGRTARPVDDDHTFVESALEHRMAGLALWAANNDLLVVGAPARQRLAAFKWAAAAHGRKVASSAATTVAVLRSRGWDAALFKGIATERRWYPESGTRPAADADLLLDAAGARSVDEILAMLVADHSLTGKAQALIDHGFIQSVDLVIEGIWIDLHIDPIKIGIPLPGVERLWERHEVLTLGSTEIRALDAEASLLQAAIHLQKDRFSRLHGFADVARIAREPDLDWTWIQGFAEEIGLSTHFNESLRVVSETLGIELPVAPDKRSRVWRVIWGERTRLAGSVGMTRRVRTHYWIPFTIPGRRLEALKWWLRLIFPPTVLIDYLHPDSSGPYLWRILQYRLRLAREPPGDGVARQAGPLGDIGGGAAALEVAHEGRGGVDTVSKFPL